MSYKPASLQALEALWSANGGVNLGVVGNQRHCAGYHLGRDRIYGPCACTLDGSCEPGLGDADYSVKATRDRLGLTNAASAIDFGKLGGSLANLYAFSAWLVGRCQAKAAGSSDVREIIYSPDGVKVQRYSGLDGLIHTGPGNGDLSHKGHTHVSYLRDSELRDKRPLIAPYFAIRATATEALMGVTFEIAPNATIGSFEVQGSGHAFLKLDDGKLYAVPDGFAKSLAFGPVIIDKGTILGDTLIRRTGYLVPNDAAFFLDIDGDFKPLPDLTPFDKADVDAAVKAAVNGRLDRIALADAALAAKIKEERIP